MVTQSRCSKCGGELSADSLTCKNCHGASDPAQDLPGERSKATIGGTPSLFSTVRRALAEHPMGKQVNIGAVVACVVLANLVAILILLFGGSSSGSFEQRLAKTCDERFPDAASICQFYRDVCMNKESEVAANRCKDLGERIIQTVAMKSDTLIAPSYVPPTPEPTMRPPVYPNRNQGRSFVDLRVVRPDEPANFPPSNSWNLTGCANRCGDGQCARNPCTVPSCSCVENENTCPRDCCPIEYRGGVRVLRQGCFDEFPPRR